MGEETALRERRMRSAKELADSIALVTAASCTALRKKGFNLKTELLLAPGGEECRRGSGRHIYSGPPMLLVEVAKRAAHLDKCQVRSAKRVLSRAQTNAAYPGDI